MRLHDELYIIYLSKFSKYIIVCKYKYIKLSLSSMIIDQSDLRYELNTNTPHKLYRWLGIK